MQQAKSVPASVDEKKSKKTINRTNHVHAEGLLLFPSTHSSSWYRSLEHHSRVSLYLELRSDLPFSSLKYDAAITAPLSAIQLPVNRITDLYLPTP